MTNGLEALTFKLADDTEMKITMHTTSTPMLVFFHSELLSSQLPMDAMAPRVSGITQGTDRLELQVLGWPEFFAGWMLKPGEGVRVRDFLRLWHYPVHDEP